MNEIKDTNKYQEVGQSFAVNVPIRNTVIDTSYQRDKHCIKS